MSNLWILDTDHVSLFQNGHPAVTQRIRRMKPENLAVTVITLQEKMKGWLKAIHDCNNQPFKSDKLIWAYKGLGDEIEFFKNIKLLDFNKDAFEIYRLLVIDRHGGIGTQDLRIAAIAKSVDGILVTRNWKDFKKVDFVALDDWTKS